jgi:membrane protease YdiL (CAAX protease family)
VAQRPPGGLSEPLSGLVTALRIIVALVLSQAALIAGFVLLTFAGFMRVPSQSQGTFELIGLGIAEGAALVMVLVLWHFIDKRPIRELGLNGRRALAQWLRGGAVAALMMGFIVLVWYTLLDGATWAVNPDPLRAASVLIGGLGGFVIQGAAEEFIFRGYVFENVRLEWGLRWAVIVSSLAFGLYHAANPSFGVLPLINLILFGAGAALYKVRIDNGQLWGVCGIHSIWNWLQQVVFGLPNSGNVTQPENALFVVTPNTSLPDPIWGGGFGPEGTLAASLVLLALLGLALRRRAAVETSGARADLAC